MLEKIVVILNSILNIIGEGRGGGGGGFNHFMSTIIVTFIMTNIFI